MASKLESFIHNSDIAKLLLRLSVGGLLIPHGIAKLINGVGPIKQMLEARHLPGFIAYGAFIGELIAPALLILGLWSRLSALVLSFNMLMTFPLALGWAAFTLNKNGGLTGELNLLLLFSALAVFFLGSGKYSISKGKGFWD